MKWTTALIVSVSAMLLAAGACRADSETESDIRRSVVRISASQARPQPPQTLDERQPRDSSSRPLPRGR